MNSINYLKFDLRIIKESEKKLSILLVLIPFFAFISGGEKSYNFAVSYLFLFLIILAGIPFSIEGNIKSRQMYSMFPAKISSMVLGRFLYLICSAIILFTVIGIATWFLYKKNEFKGFDILTICLPGFFSLLMCFIQYPLYYKFGMENGKIMSIIIYIIPAVVAFSSPDIFKEISVFGINNNSILILLSVLLVIFIGFISYIISYKVCRNKQM